VVLRVVGDACRQEHSDLALAYRDLGRRPADGSAARVPVLHVHQ